jgi:hypothetical protein
MARALLLLKSVARVGWSDNAASVTATASTGVRRIVRPYAGLAANLGTQINSAGVSQVASRPCWYASMISN